MMPADLKELLRALNAHSVKFSAPIPNRGPRRTWIFSFSPMRRTARPSTARSPTSALLCTTFHQPIFAMAAPFRLAALPPESTSSVEGDIQVAVISREDLIRNKLASGREQDLLDVKKLRASAAQP